MQYLPLKLESGFYKVKAGKNAPYVVYCFDDNVGGVFLIKDIQVLEKTYRKSREKEVMLQHATFPIRCKAFLIDYLFILAYLAVLFVLHVLLFPSLQELFNGSLLVAQFVGFLMVTLPVLVYFIISDSLLGGQSFGKRKMRIKVVTENGDRLSLPHAIYRTFLKFLPWELSHYLVYRLVNVDDMSVLYYTIGGLIYVLLFSYILTAIFSKKKQSVYDIIAKTQVIKVSS